MVMYKYYVILAHNNPFQLKILLNSLNDKLSKFYIHIDEKCDIEMFKATIEGDNIHFLSKRYLSIWGNINIILATIESFKEVLAREKNNGFLILLSGSDYPIKSNDYINNFLNENSDYNFINITPINKIWTQYESTVRLKKYNFSLSYKSKEILTIPPFFSMLFFSDCKSNLKKVFLLSKSKQWKSVFSLLKNRKNYIPPYGGTTVDCFKQKYN